MKGTAAGSGSPDLIVRRSEGTVAEARLLSKMIDNDVDTS